ncbi:uncharacterized protein LOC129613611 [Condylostylus longicornis]|uniref:uncharacterized protein LOC129613611 n=1 Tax=Condylostylus longicornis TaxID=2530218 RepID=UPI00244DB0AC|nr:uncharacterized protein LOC129613611 [Condylostylus longicornis]
MIFAAYGLWIAAFVFDIILKPAASLANTSVVLISVCEKQLPVPSELSPYIELVLCPGRQQPWNCARDQTARLLDEMNDIVKYQWQMLKAEADRELNTTLLQRGFSSSDVKEKPSTILKKIEIGTNFIQNFVEQTADVVMGRERNDYDDEEDDDDDDEDENDDDDDDVEENVINKNSKTKTDNKNQIQKKQAEELKKKGQISHLQPALVLVQSQKPQHGISLGGHGGGGHGGHGGGHLSNLIGHKIGHKLKKKKKRPFGGHGGLLGGGHGGSLMSFFHQNSEIGTSALSFLEDLLDSGVSGIPHTHGLSSINNGRSIGVGRGKKKKKKALMKLMLIGTIIKGKIELLLKILSAHLQVKFFAIALVGLIINIARFWIDIRRGGVPQKHHYEDHGNIASGDDWTAGTGPSSNSGYWKRSLGEKKREAKSFPPSEENSSTSYGNSPVYTNNAEHFSAGAYNSDPSYLAYSSQLPSYY